MRGREESAAGFMVQEVAGEAVADATCSFRMKDSDMGLVRARLATSRGSDRAGGKASEIERLTASAGGEVIFVNAIGDGGVGSSGMRCIAQFECEGFKWSELEGRSEEVSWVGG